MNRQPKPFSMGPKVKPNMPFHERRVAASIMSHKNQSARLRYHSSDQNKDLIENFEDMRNADNFSSEFKREECV